ncbi:MAG: trypsin-like peptidase domain-containing protein [Candidatus Melainabacteria bacterium]|nr:trypsin-like peptidase domain-containing protein [Candidatus Melainabacteria bacterium]
MSVDKRLATSLAGSVLSDKLAPAFAQVLTTEAGREVVLGQAWVVGHNILATCGHVVEPFARSPKSVFVRFPYSGNRYTVQGIKLHPSFVRQPDKLVKFDLAVLMVSLYHPDCLAVPLPFSFEQELKSSQTLSAVRYPIHLSELTAAPEPLAQEGRYLGHLRKHDNFHLLHDLALSPGDSGCAIFAGSQVVGIHCGDTATLPGLNLPTTAVRMFIWIDAIRELGIRQTSSHVAAYWLRSWLWAGLTMALFFLATVAVSMLVLWPRIQAGWSIQQPAIMPVDITFNKPTGSFRLGDEAQIVLVSRSDCWLYLFDVDDAKHVYTFYPPYGFPAYVKAGQPRTIDRFGSNLLKVGSAKDKLYLVALNSDFPLVSKSDWDNSDPAGRPLKISGNELLERIVNFQKADPKNVLYWSMDAPRAQ